jgi:hypothetical protein
MKDIKCIEIEPEDVDNTDRLFWKRVKPEVADAALTAEVVLYRGEVIKNRNGNITKVAQ